MILVSYLFAYLFQGDSPGNQFPGSLHSAAGDILMEGHIQFFLEQLCHGGHTDSAVRGNDLQRDLLRHVRIHINRDLLLQALPPLSRSGAFLTVL